MAGASLLIKDIDGRDKKNFKTGGNNGTSVVDNQQPERQSILAVLRISCKLKVEEGCNEKESFKTFFWQKKFFLV